MCNKDAWLDLFKSTTVKGLESSPRGYKIVELLNATLTIDPMQPFMNFKHRKLNIDYIKKEIVWKLTADPYNDSIVEHAKIWKSTQNPDGTFNSNYGQYWFGKQMGFYKAFNELAYDRDSRRAIIPMLNDSHIGPGVNDTVCTESVIFLIRADMLNMVVHMRSSDQIFGLGVDIPAFAFLQRLMLASLSNIYPELSLGTLSISAASSHIYERHFKMVNDIIADPTIDETVEMPLATRDEALKLVACRGNIKKSWGDLSSWLTDQISTNTI